MKHLLIGILFFVTCISCDSENFPLSNRCGAPGIAVYENSSYRNLFDQSAVRLSGGEIRSRIKWDDKSIWLLSNATFNDRPDVLRNALVLQHDANLTLVFTIPDRDNSSFLTINQGHIQGGDLELIVSQWSNNGPGRANTIHQGSFVYSVSLSNWQVKDIVAIDGPQEFMFGSAVLLSGADTYIYATRNAFWNKEAAIARVSGSWLNSWEYFNGSNWVGESGAMRPVLSGVSDFFSVFEESGNFYAVSYGALLSQEIQLFQAYSPNEGWQFRKTLYCGKPAEGILNSDAIVIDHSDDSLTCSYNRINSSLDDFGNVAPFFIDIHHWNY